MRQQVWRDLFNRAASAAGPRDYSLFGMGMRRVDAAAFGVRRALAALVFTQRKAARARRTPNAPRSWTRNWKPM